MVRQANEKVIGIGPEGVLGSLMVSLVYQVTWDLAEAHRSQAAD